MFVRKPLFLLEGDDEPGGGDNPVEPEAPQPDAEPDAPQEDAEPEAEVDDEPFDAARALAKIKKANSEAAAQRKRAKAAEDGLKPAARDAALQRVARRLSLPDSPEVDEFLDRLKGDTVDELAQDAERLLTLLAPKSEPKPTTRKPTEALRGGGDPDTEPVVDNKKLAERILSGF